MSNNLQIKSVVVARAKERLLLISEYAVQIVAFSYNYFKL